jgi:hypothetical protein
VEWLFTGGGAASHRTAAESEHGCGTNLRPSALIR